VVFDSNLNFVGHIEETKIVDYGNGRFIIAENAEGVLEVQEFTKEGNSFFYKSVYKLKDGIGKKNFTLDQKGDLCHFMQPNQLVFYKNKGSEVV